MKIIAFGNSKYKRVAHNWALYLQKHGITNYTVISLDNDIYNYLVKNNINTEPAKGDMFANIDTFIGTVDKFDWKTRFEYIFDYLKRGIDILHSDLDAIWLKNPLNLIKEDDDILASTGRYPGDIYETVGYTLCLGWIYYKSSTIVRELFQTILRSELDKFDDQIELNREVFTKNKWKNLKLRILDQAIIPRNYPHNENTYVVHPVLNSGVDREEYFKSKNLWILK